MKYTQVILKENEMDRAQLILAAQAVVDDIQDMAEKVAKMEAEGIMPLLDGIRTNFGQEFADRLSNDATAALRAALEGLKTSKDQIGANIANMEQMVTGEGPGNDMATGVGTPAAAAQPAAPEATAEPDSALASEPAAEEPVDDLADVFGGEDAPVGRDTKESFVARNVKALSESANPDRLVATYALRRYKAGESLRESVIATAKAFDIDRQDVVAIVQEQLKK